MWTDGTKFAIAFWALLPEDEERAVFARELRSALRLTVRISRAFIVSCDKFVI